MFSMSRTKQSKKVESYGWRGYEAINVLSMFNLKKRRPEVIWYLYYRFRMNRLDKKH
jgi:hypothetical protein